MSFFVVEGRPEALLGGHFCIKYKLVTINVPRSQIPLRQQCSVQQVILHDIQTFSESSIYYWKLLQSI